MRSRSNYYAKGPRSSSGLPADGAEGEHAFAAAGFTPFVVTGDLASEAFCDELVAAVLARHGRLDYLVNNAFSFIAKGLDATREDFLRSLSVGPIAFARLIQLVAEPMKRVGAGRLLMFLVFLLKSPNRIVGLIMQLKVRSPSSRVARPLILRRTKFA